MKRYTKELIEDVRNDDLINEFMNRFYKVGKNEFLEDFIVALKEKGYVIVYPKYMVQKSMLEDYITENNLDD